MYFAKYSDLRNIHAKPNEYGFLPASSDELYGWKRVEIWNKLANLLSETGEELLPGPIDLAEYPKEGAEKWLHILDNGDRIRGHMNPGMDYDFYFIQDDQTIVGLLATACNQHPFYLAIRQEAEFSGLLDQPGGKLAYISTFYISRDYRGRRLGKRLLDFALSDLRLQAYSHLLLCELLETADPLETKLPRLRFFLQEDWQVLHAILPDPSRTDSNFYPYMQPDRRSQSVGSVWLVGHL